MPKKSRKRKYTKKRRQSRKRKYSKKRCKSNRRIKSRKKKTNKRMRKKGGTGGKICPKCNLFTSNKWGDYCCRTCGNSKGARHGNSILKGGDHPDIHKSITRD